MDAWISGGDFGNLLYSSLSNPRWCECQVCLCLVGCDHQLFLERSTTDALSTQVYCAFNQDLRARDGPNINNRTVLTDVHLGLVQLGDFSDSRATLCECTIESNTW